MLNKISPNQEARVVIRKKGVLCSMSKAGLSTMSSIGKDVVVSVVFRSSPPVEEDDDDAAVVEVGCSPVVDNDDDDDDDDGGGGGSDGGLDVEPVVVIEEVDRLVVVKVGVFVVEVGAEPVDEEQG
jgi:hypothetical protein